MKTKALMSMIILAIFLSGCGEESDISKAVPLTGEQHLDLTKPNVARMYLYADDGTPITVLCPQNYDWQELDTEYQAFRFFEVTSENEARVYVTYAIVPNGDVGSVLANPIAYITDNAEIASNDVSDIVGYITGDDTIVGLESAPTVDFSKYNPELPKVYLPEISYVFQLPDGDYLLLRVALDSNFLKETIDTAEALRENAYSELQLSEELQDSEITKVSLEQVAVMFMERTFVGNY